MKKAILFFVWVILLIWITSIGCDLINKPNTIANLIGIIIILAYGLISVKTKCFTLIKKQ